MPNVQQQEMRRSGHTRLVQDSDRPPPGGHSPRRERRSVPAEQLPTRGPQARGTASDEPKGRPAEGD